MKLTEEKLKKLIYEELARSLSEQEEQPAQANADQQSADKVDSTGKLKQELVDLSREIINIKGLDPAELNLISGIMGMIFKIASAGSGSTLLKRVYDVLQKNAN